MTKGKKQIPITFLSPPQDNGLYSVPGQDPVGGKEITRVEFAKIGPDGRYRICKTCNYPISGFWK